MKTKWLKSDLLEAEVKNNLAEATTVLDIGCGIMPQKLLRPLIHICCEPYDEYLQRLREKLKDVRDRNYLFVHASWQDATKLFPKKSIDSIFLLDVIEHLEKSEAKKLIKKTEKIAKKQLIIFTTLGFVPQHHEDGKDAWGLGGGAWQEHKSGWQPEDFGDGWEVFACKQFHLTNNMGEPLKNPSGVLFAIKNIGSEENRFATKVNSLYFKAIEVHSYPAIAIAVEFIKLYTGIKKAVWAVVKIFWRGRSN